MNRDFDKWFSTTTNSIETWDYYVDYAKVEKNITKHKKELILLSSIIEGDDIETDFIELITKYPKVLECIPILLAKRENKILITETDKQRIYNFKKTNFDKNEYADFMKKIGLFDLITSLKKCSVLEAYAKGIEVGMDTNARKNRTGKLMENLTEDFIKKAGFVKEIDYFSQIKKSKLEEMYNLDLSFVPDKKEAEKKFDFVIKAENKIYAIECNFYHAGGSKLNEVARSYKQLAEECAKHKEIMFIWITDGAGRKTAKNNLEETFSVFDNIYDINDMRNGLFSKIIK